MPFTELITNCKQYKEIQLNIHLCLPKDITNYCLELNKSIIDTNNEHSMMIFDNTNLTFPHITISTGFVTDINNLTEILNKVETFALNTKKIKLTPHNLFFSSKYEGAKEYLFLNFNEDELIQDLKKSLSLTLKNTYSSNIKWNFLEATPHISLAVFHSKFTLPNNFIKQAPKDISIERIGISISGKYGTCVGTLKEFYLQ